MLDVMDGVNDSENVRKAMRKECCGGCEGAVVSYQGTVIQ